MKVLDYNCRLVILLLFAFILQVSFQYRYKPDLPWKNLYLHQNSNIEASDLILKLNKSNKLNVVPKVIFYNNLQKDSMFYMLQQWENISSLCHKTIEKLGDVSSQLISCFVRNARPITVCQNCVEEYIDFYDVYKNICISATVKQMQDCRSQVLNKDKLNVIQKTCNFASSLWSDGYCSNCFEKENGSLSSTLNNETKEFLKLYKSINKCFQDSSSKVYKGATAENDTVCDSCRKVYNSFRKDYNDLEQKYPQSVCMDLTDIMNTTRDLWSGYYNCIEMTASGVFVYILASIFCILVALFYSGFRFIAHAQNTRIIGQKRFVTKHKSSSSSGRHQMDSFQ